MSFWSSAATHKYVRPVSAVINAFSVLLGTIFLIAQRSLLAPPALNSALFISTSVLAAFITAGSVFLIGALATVRPEKFRHEVYNIGIAVAIVFQFCLAFGNVYDNEGLRDANGHLIYNGFISLYFSVVTMTTLGYGDFTPTNTVGRVAAASEALFGYVMLALLIAKLTVVLNGVADGRYTKSTSE